jgi:hypothetical protein
VGVNSPKATLSFLPKDFWGFPPRIAQFWAGVFHERPSHRDWKHASYSGKHGAFVPTRTSKTVRKTEIRTTLGHVTTSQTLGKRDPDTGLQQDQGPGRLRFITVAVRRNFSQGSLLATFSKADARDLDTGQPTPEAPRTIFDLLGTMQKLPLRLQARGEFEYVPAKPLGTGCLLNQNVECIGVPVKEFRAAVIRPFMDGRLTVGVNMLIASGHTGQTLESFAPSDVSEIVGVRIPSYAGVTLAYRFGRNGPP